MKSLPASANATAIPCLLALVISREEDAIDDDPAIEGATTKTLRHWSLFQLDTRTLVEACPSRDHVRTGSKATKKIVQIWISFKAMFSPFAQRVDGVTEQLAHFFLAKKVSKVY